MTDKYQYRIPDALPFGEKLRLLELLMRARAESTHKLWEYRSPERIEELEEIAEWEAHYYDPS